MRRPSGEEDVTSRCVYGCQYWCYTYQRVNLFRSSYTMAVNLIALPQQLGLLLFPEIPSPHVQRVSGTCSFHWTGSVNGAKRNFSYIWFTLLWHRIMTSVSLQRCKSQMWRDRSEQGLCEKHCGCGCKLWFKKVWFFLSLNSDIGHIWYW